MNIVLHTGGDEDEGDAGGKEKLLGMEEEVPLLVWLRMLASLAVLRWRPMAEREREGE